MVKDVSVAALLVGSLLATGCAFESSSKLFNPTAPSDTAGNTSSTGGSSSASASMPSVFNGAWGSSTIAGLPLGTCSDVKWVITTYTNNQISGTVTANCASGVAVSANLAGTVAGADRINLVATGMLSAMGLPCTFTLTGSGTRASNDTMKVDYTGSYCFGIISGSENLRKFPNI